MRRGKWVTSDDLCQAILTDGIENVRFIVPFQIAFDNEKDIVCKIEERFNREVKQNYKIILIPEKNETGVTYVDYYTSDFVSLIKSGYIKIVA